MTTDKIVVFDVESTGVDSHNDRVIQLFIGVYNRAGECLKKWSWEINAGVDIPEEATAVHGYTREWLERYGEDPKEVFAEARDVFLQNLKLPWIAYNLSFDLTFLDEEFKRHGLSETFGVYAKNKARLFDPLVVDRAKDRYRKGKRTLEATARHYGIEFDPELAHDAAYDVAITAQVALAVIKRYGWVSNVDQAMMHLQWSKGLQSYFDRKGIEDTVETSWPLRERRAQ